ncbi:MAG: molybdopterin-dependent oxidoreductase [Bacteroides sp.]|jgi:formate dehydrogenase major subunit|nr:molybdopterin-dependent oxidoreductase [Bacteroides sp.]
MSHLNIILNKRIVKGIAGETILELARRLGIEIPTLCHDDRLEPYSSCYLCVVEVEGMRGLQPACSTRITEGMRIETENERVSKSRKMALELLVSNHYADCIAPCRETCPAGVDVQGYIAMINKGMHREAVEIIKNTNPLPAICGRVCVRPCELACRRNLVEGIGVGIDYLKRYTSDIDLEAPDRFMPVQKPASGKKVAVIGAGPGGLSAAFFLTKEGHHVEIFEGNAHAGGMLRYGIPPYRLPNDIIDKEVEGITGLGAEIHYNLKLGDNLSYAELKSNFDAVILAIGSQNGTRIGCENDDAGNIFSGIDFLRNMEATGQKYDFSGKKVGVIGGGNTAMDCCRTAMRCGAEEVTVIYRRTEKEMPANPIEIHESKLEGVNYLFLTAPARVNPDETGNIRSLTCFQMELGEPDASGRRRPVKIDGSEFDVELDIVLAAIGQKTNVNFIEDINRHAEKELVLNKWGDIAADAKTLHTSIENVFACGDGVTGPATLIEAIAQGRLAAQSCNKFLLGQEVSPPAYEFLSRRENFQKQLKADYEAWYEKQEREEMPTLDPAKRNNFKEVELGYQDQAAIKETLRCLECGCTELYTCDLKRYATKYEAVQGHFKGDYRKFQVRYDHPFVEIDNNKCILCSRCVRICSEVVGANALGLINRGFDTFIAPSLGESLLHTYCESCGMCIETCPTGAITENVPFKPGPVPLDQFNTICNYCSVGCQITLHHKSSFFAKASGSHGLINKDASLCRYGKFGYRYLNDPSRITKPLLKQNGSFKEISFEQAFDLIGEKILGVKPNKNAFFAGARLSNEEIYLLQKLARAAVLTNNISSFHYLGRGSGYFKNSHNNVPFDQIHSAQRIFLLGSELNLENAVPGFYINNLREKQNIPLEVITTAEQSAMAHKADKVLTIKSYVHFLRAANHYILSNKLQNNIFIDDHCTGLDEYSQQLLAHDFNTLLEGAGCSKETLAAFVENFNNEHQSIILYSEKHLNSSACHEVHNLAYLTGKPGKNASGLISLKEKNNAQGIFDMGASAALAPGGKNLRDKTVLKQLENFWKTSKLSAEIEEDQWGLLSSGKLKNVFVFGEDPLGCAIDKDLVRDSLMKSDFLVVQDLFMTETASMANLILPASLHFETGGSFTNTQKFIQQFEDSVTGPVALNNLQQLMAMAKALGTDWTYEGPADVLLEVANVIQQMPANGKAPFSFHLPATDQETHYFNHGCDYLVKYFDDEWEKAFNQNQS